MSSWHVQGFKHQFTYFQNPIREFSLLRNLEIVIEYNFIEFNMSCWIECSHWLKETNRSLNSEAQRWNTLRAFSSANRTYKSIKMSSSRCSRFLNINLLTHIQNHRREFYFAMYFKWFQYSFLPSFLRYWPAIIFKEINSEVNNNDYRDSIISSCNHGVQYRSAIPSILLI